MAALDFGGALTAELGPVVGSLARERDAVIRAIDILLLGV